MKVAVAGSLAQNSRQAKAANEDEDLAAASDATLARMGVLLKKSQPQAAQLAQREFIAEDLTKATRQLARFKQERQSHRPGRGQKQPRPEVIRLSRDRNEKPRQLLAGLFDEVE